MKVLNVVDFDLTIQWKLVYYKGWIFPLYVIYDIDLDELNEVHNYLTSLLITIYAWIFTTITLFMCGFKHKSIVKYTFELEKTLMYGNLKTKWLSSL